MTSLKQELDMLGFAFENGFNKVERIEQKDKSVAYIGAWGTFVVEEWDAIVIDAVIKTLNEKYTIVKSDNIEVIEKIKINELSDLTLKEKEVMLAIIENSYEYGLGMETSDIANNLSIKGKTLSGVIGSLFKKGYLETYLDDNAVDFASFFHLTSDWFDKLVID